MENEHRLKQIGDSKWFLMPYKFVDVYDLDQYVYYLEISKSGKKITFSRMRKDERLEEK